MENDRRAQIEKAFKTIMHSYKSEDCTLVKYEILNINLRLDIIKVRFYVRKDNRTFWGEIEFAINIILNAGPNIVCQILEGDLKAIYKHLCRNVNYPDGKFIEE